MEKKDPLNFDTVVMSPEGYSKLVDVSEVDYSKTEGGKNIHWTTDVHTELPIKMSKSGPGKECSS
jgi:hypothetical protein